MPKRLRTANSRVDAGREAFGGDGVEDFAGQGVVAPLDGLDFLAVRVVEGVFLVGEDFHLVGWERKYSMWLRRGSEGVRLVRGCRGDGTGGFRVRR